MMIILTLSGWLTSKTGPKWSMCSCI